MNKITKRAGYEYNHFRRLPEELIVSIFDKIGDLKCLCHCSLVSKHFASIIPHVRTVSITVTGNANYDMEYMDRVNEFAKKCMDSDGRQFNNLPDSFSLQHMKLPAFLGKLTKLECVDLDYHCLGLCSNSPSPMRTMKFYSDGYKKQSFVFLEPRYMHKDTENEPDEEEDIEDTKVDAFRGAYESLLRFCIRYMEWICFMILLAKGHASVQKVTITDSGVNGKMVIGDEHCVNKESVVLSDLLKLIYFHAVSRIGWVPVLQLPSSGYIMRGVTLLIVDFSDTSCTRAKKLEEMGFCELDDELPVFREAVKKY